MKISNNGRRIDTARVTVCSICGYRVEPLKGERDPHCLGHHGLVPLAQGEGPRTREIYLADYVPPPYVARPEKARKRLGEGQKRPEKKALSLPAILA